MSRKSNSKWSLVALLLLPFLCSILCLLQHLGYRAIGSLLQAGQCNRDPVEVIRPLAELEWPDDIKEVEQILDTGPVYENTEALVSISNYDKEAEIDFLFLESATWIEFLSDSDPYTSISVSLEVCASDEEAKARAEKMAVGGAKRHFYSTYGDVPGNFQFEHGVFADGRYWMSNTLVSKPWIDPRYYSVILLQKKNVLISILEENALKCSPHKAEVIAILAEAMMQEEP